MNRYVRAGVLADMRAGKNVLVLTSTTMQLGYTMRDIAAEVGPGEGVARAHGHERIWNDKATVRFRSHHGSLRGLQVDVVIVDADWNEIAPETQWELEHLVCRHGEIVRWT